MFVVAAVDWRHYLFMIPLMLLSIFLILVILVQRGRGGGLTGALGGMGGQSAFGTKAGDLFTRITIVVAAIWVLLSMASLKVLNQYSMTGGLSPSQRGQITPASKTGEGALLPSATKTDGAALRTPESGTPATDTPAEAVPSETAPINSAASQPDARPATAPPATAAPATPQTGVAPSAPSADAPAADASAPDNGAKP
jgi:preprotein translocase subunit SecG